MFVIEPSKLKAVSAGTFSSSDLEDFEKSLSREGLIASASLLGAIGAVSWLFFY